MDNEKYYIPSRDEFHVGLEYEALWGLEGIDGEWLKEIFTERSSIESLEETIRVKYLNKADIEAEGFTDTKDRGMAEHTGYLFKNRGGITIRYWSINNRVKIENHNRIDKTVFDGEIKNQSEFRKILKMIGA
jgi:hypothetical protein